MGKRLFYLPVGDIRNQDMLEYRLERECIQTIRCLERYGEQVFVDTATAPLASSRQILQQADLVVVNLSQNRQMLDHFFRNYSTIQEKAFYLIGDYDGESELTRAEIIRRYQIPGRRIGVIPHSVQFSDAVSEGELIPFLLRNYDCENWNNNHDFMMSAREAVMLFRNQMMEKGG